MNTSHPASCCSPGRLAGLLLLSGLAIWTGGCESSTGEAGGPLELSGELTVGDELRTYEAYIPASEAAGDSFPLLVLLHGARSNGAGIRAYTRMNDWAGELGFAVAYPDALLEVWAEDCGCVEPDLLGVNDTGFVRALVDTLARSFPIDRGRVFAAGFSQGGFFAFRLACQMSDVFSAVGSVAGAMGVPVAERCAPDQPVSMILFHGAGDSTFPWDGGGSGDFAFLGVEAAAALWASFDDCPADPVVTAVPDTADDGRSASEALRSPCRDGTEVVFYRVENGAHGWHLTLDLPTASAVAEFFLRQPRRDL